MLFEPFDNSQRVSDWLKRVAGEISATCITSSTSVTAMVPRDGFELQVFQVFVDSPDFATPASVTGIRIIDGDV